jgi:hypothetical protein
MKRYKIISKLNEFFTVGEWFDGDTSICKTLELAWKDNKRSVSCIPAGVYRVTKEKPIPKNDPSGRKERPYGHFRIHNVPNRSGILVHRITYVKDLQGCIGVGSRHHDFNKDGIPDMAESSVKLEWMYQNLANEFELEIIRL